MALGDAVGAGESGLEESTYLLNQLPSNERRNRFGFAGGKAVIASGDNMQLGVRHPMFEMEPDGDRADWIGVAPDE